MKKYRIGKTGLMVSEVGLGGIPLARVSFEQSTKVVKRAIELGINFIDTANAYKDSEEKIGIGIKGQRDKVILATKSTRRDKKHLLENIDNSLMMFQTDYIDLFQIHQVSGDKEMELVFGENGAYEGALKAKKAGKILHIGVTSHRLQTAIELVKTGKFETMQFSANFLEKEALETLFPEAIKNDMGCIIMKPLGGGELRDPKLCFRFLQLYPEYIPIPGISEVAEIEEIVELYENKKSLTTSDYEKIEQIKTEVGTDFCRRCGYCEPCPQGVMIFVAMSLHRIVNNYGKEYKPEWLLNGYKSIDKCVECGKCQTICPYNLSIINKIKENKIYFGNAIK